MSVHPGGKAQEALQVYTYLGDCIKKKEPNFSVVSRDKRQVTQTEICENNSEQKKKGSHCEDYQTMEWISSRGCSIPVYGDTETFLEVSRLCEGVLVSVSRSVIGLSENNHQKITGSRKKRVKNFKA